MEFAFALTVLCSAIGIDYFFRQRVVVQFGLLDADPAKGHIVSSATTRIPFRPNDSAFIFGMRFFKRSGRAFRAKIVHVLPHPPSTLGGDLTSRVELPDGRYRVESGEQTYQGGGVRSLHFSEGDPTGRYEMHLFINGRLRKVVRYDVVSDAC